MLRSILVGLDGSGGNDDVVAWAVGQARRLDAVVVGLGVVDEPGIRAREPYRPVGGVPGIDPVIYPGYEAQLALVRRRVEQGLDDLARRCGDAGVRLDRRLCSGAPRELILREVPGYDLVVLGRQTHFRVTGRDEPDGMACEVLKESPRPVVVVPTAAAGDGSILVAYDGSVQACRALADFAGTGLGDSAAVHVVHVAADAAAATEHLERARRFLAFHGIEATPHLRDAAGPPARAILDLAKDLGARLLVMGAYGRPFVREFLVGSVTRSLLDDSPIPLFLDH